MKDRGTLIKMNMELAKRKAELGDLKGSFFIVKRKEMAKLFEQDPLLIRGIENIKTIFGIPVFVLDEMDEEKLNKEGWLLGEIE